MTFKWYIVHVYSGFEYKVKKALEEQIATSPLKEKFKEILVPAEQVFELVKGKRKETSKKFYPGYILVRMELNDSTWHIVNNTAKVTGFLGGKNKPAPISDIEVDRILNRIESGAKQPQLKNDFKVGDDVEVIDGPFTNFNGVVEDVNPEKGKVKVSVSIFGRATPVELDFGQVKQI